ncbi:hypothetical protein ACTWKB_07550 [Bacillus sp. 4A_MP2]
MEFEQLLNGWNEELLETEGILEVVLIILLLHLLEESEEGSASEIKELLCRGLSSAFRCRVFI